MNHSYADILPLLRKVMAAPFEMQAIMRQHGYVLDNLEDRMQKLAFTFYDELVELSKAAETLLPEADVASVLAAWGIER